MVNTMLAYIRQWPRWTAGDDTQSKGFPNTWRRSVLPSNQFPPLTATWDCSLQPAHEGHLQAASDRRQEWRAVAISGKFNDPMPLWTHLTSSWPRNRRLDSRSPRATITYRA